MTRMPTPRIGGLLATVAKTVGIGLLAGGSLVGAEAISSFLVRLERSAGEPVRGDLLSVAADTIRILIDGEPHSFPVAEVRRVVREEARAERHQPVRVVTRDGSHLAGDDFLQTADRCLIGGEAGPIEIPAERIARVAWLGEREPEPAWLAAVPAEPAADLVVVRREDGHTFVECAVSGVDGDAVTVVLDGETIPVKRGKVAGIVWLRAPAPRPAGPVVAVVGGRLTVERIRWSPEAFLLDEAIRLPPAALLSIDYAAGRTLPLATLDPERVTVEPAFGSLAAIEGLADFFAPRTIPPADGDGPAALILRPRTVATWRVPPGGRRFRARLSRNVAETATTTVDICLDLDGREVFRTRLSGAADQGGIAPVPIDLDVTAGRRLTLTVDFVGSDLGCPVRLAEAVFER